MAQQYKVGSIITIEDGRILFLADKMLNTTIKTISIVSHIDGNNLYCKNSICSVDGGEWQHTRNVLPKYEGELAETINLIDGDDFDIVIDSKLIDRSELQDL